MDQDGPETLFSASTTLVGGHLTVVVTGEVDMSTAGTMSEAAIAGEPTAVTLDLRGVTFFDSAAIHALIRLAEQRPGILSVLPSPQVRRVLDISGLGTQPWLSMP